MIKKYTTTTKKSPFISKLLSHAKSVKFKLTICCAGFMFFVTILSLYYIYIVNAKDTFHSLKNTLRTSIDNIISEISKNNSEININNIISYNSYIHIIIYDEHENILYNNKPGQFEQDFLFKDFIDGSLRSVSFENDDYYIYDRIIFTSAKLYSTERFDYISDEIRLPSDYTLLHIRGYSLIESNSFLEENTFEQFLVFLPFVILLASIAFYHIIQKTFQSMDNIITTTKSIASEKNFSEQIKIKSEDEFSDLAKVLNQTFDKVKESLEKERQFTSDASHELRTPTAVIFAQIEYLHSICDKPEEKHACEVIINQTVKMSGLISELLTLTRMDHNKQTLSLELIDISELLELVVEESLDSANEYDIRIYSDIQPNILMNADQTMMMRVFINLINNSVKYGTYGGWIKIYLSKSENHIIFSISDNGIGISEKNLPKIWERFFQANSSRSNEKGGSGLGLAIVKWIVEAHGGTITAESELDVGTTFRIIF